jgi:hypothetical protein
MLSLDVSNFSKMSRNIRKIHEALRILQRLTVRPTKILLEARYQWRAEDIQGSKGQRVC